ncbi:unnamed protein product [Lota lota]
MAVEKRGVGVEVIGVPDLMSVDRTVDKLLIHFLRPRNGGGEVRRVIYPTHLPGRALVIYDEPDVAFRVLQNRRHELQIGDQHFSLEVKPVDRPELDLPVEATLNVTMIADEGALKRLLHRHGFEIIEQDSRRGQVRVKGSMMMLRSFKAETQKLLKAQTPPRLSSSSSSPGQSPTPPGADSRNSTHGSSMDTRAYASPSPTPSSSSTSSSLSAVGPVDSRHLPPKKLPTESVLVPSDVLDYAQRYKKLGIEDILASNGVKMDVVAMDTDVSRVYVTGRGAQVATAELQSLLSDLLSTLRTRQVPLGDLDHDAQVGVAKRIQELKHRYPLVLIKQMGGAIHLIGPRSSCDELKERVMQERPAELLAPVRTGRSQEKERSQEKSTSPKRQSRIRQIDSAKEAESICAKSTPPKRRSRSVPRNISGASRRGELAGEATPKLAPLSSLDGGHSSQRARDVGGQGAALTREVSSQRGRSSSVTTTSAKPEETANYGSPERTNLRPATGPVVKTSLMPFRKDFLLIKRFKL